MESTARQMESDHRSSQQKEIVKYLKSVFANTFSMHLLALGCHWNVRGPHFNALHELFGKFAKNLSQGIDDLAERMRVLGVDSPYTLQDVQGLAKIQPDTGLVLEKDMLEALTRANNFLMQDIRRVLSFVRRAQDEVTSDLLVDRLAFHENVSWNLSSLLEYPRQDSTENLEQERRLWF